MAEVSEIEAGGEVRTIKDTTARQGVTANANAIAEINEKIPTSASASNKMATNNDISNAMNKLIVRTEHGYFDMWSDGHEHTVSFNPPFPDDDNLVISVTRSYADNWAGSVSYFITKANKNGITIHTIGPQNIKQGFNWVAHYCKKEN